MSRTVYEKTLVIAGLNVNVYSNTPLSERGQPLAVLFVLHGRLGSSETLKGVAEDVLHYTQSQEAAYTELAVVTFDHRNHGTRLVDPNANNDWSKPQNERHALDMYAIQTGTASDVSFLMNFLPSYLFPAGERYIQKWMVSGISLGGHSTWIVLRDEPRVTVGIPIIGCPDYLALMRPRAESSSVPFSQPYFPPSLIAYIKSHDPSSANITSRDPSQNPFIGKHVLVLSGGKDKLVPWSASQKFVKELEVGSGSKRAMVMEDAGHECTPHMVYELARFVYERGVKIASNS